jgi:hypothetical protein
MNSTLYPFNTQTRAANSTEQYALCTLVQRSKTKLFAQWDIVNSKLVCKWHLAK